MLCYPHGKELHRSLVITQITPHRYQYSTYLAGFDQWDAHSLEDDPCLWYSVKA